MLSRRELIVAGGAALGAGFLLKGGARAEEPAAGEGAVPVETPNGATLSWEMKDGVKEFRLIAGEVEHEFAPGCRVKAWGYNGRTPGPTIECVEGDRVRIFVENRLPEPTSIHWHGVLLPNGMHGVAGSRSRSSSRAKRGRTSSRSGSTGRRCTTRTSTK